MSIEAKAVLLRSIETRLSQVITAANLPTVLSAISDEMAGYDIEGQAIGDHNDDLLDAFIAALRVQGRSEKTIERYRYLIVKMRKAVRTETRNITVHHLRRYLMQEKARGLSDSTLEGTRQVFSAYFNWLQRERLIDTNPTANLGVIKCAKKIKQIYSEVDVERMKFACKSVRDRAIICFLMSTGCRISEMTQLDRDSVDLDKLECTVLGKGNKERTVYLDAVAGMLLREYLKQRTDVLPALFIGKGTKRLSPHGVRRMLTVLAGTAKVDHVHPHKFRRTLATNLIRHGMPIQEVAAILGHDKLDTTMEYVVLDKEDLKNNYRKFAG